MFSRTFYASRSMATRAIRSQTRAFSRPAALQADAIQEMYLNQVKAFKPAPVKPSDAEGHVLKFAVPKAPNSPAEDNLTAELGAFENQTVEIDGGAPTEASAQPVEEDWFVEEEEEAAAAGH